MEEKEPVVSMVEAAQQLGVSRAHLYRVLREHGMSRLKKYGDRQTYVKQADIDKLKGFHVKE